MFCDLEFVIPCLESKPLHILFVSILLFIALHVDVCKITCVFFSIKHAECIRCTYCTNWLHSHLYVLHLSSTPCHCNALSWSHIVRCIVSCPVYCTCPWYRYNMIACPICKRRTQQHSRKYCVIHVKQKYIIIAQGFCWMILKLHCPMETGFVDCVLKDFFHLTILMIIMISWNVSKKYHNLLTL